MPEPHRFGIPRNSIITQEGFFPGEQRTILSLFYTRPDGGWKGKKGSIIEKNMRFSGVPKIAPFRTDSQGKSGQSRMLFQKSVNTFQILLRTSAARLQGASSGRLTLRPGS